MLSKGDDYPIHQLPEPVAYAGSDRNFYDRYFFNGYAREREEFFAMAFGVYPHLNIMDTSFCVIKDGVQHNLRASRHMGMERMDTRVGPVSVHVLEPLQSLRIIIEDNPKGISADLTFSARAMALEEPRYTRRVGPRVIMDATRMTQNGSYSGWIQIQEDRIDVQPESWLGTRDRSWGVRPVGAPDTQPAAPPELPQFYWLWAPVNFDDGIALYDINADENGNVWHTQGMLAGLDERAPQVMAQAESRVKFKSGTRHAESAEIRLVTRAGEEITIQVEPLFHFYMSGLGYLHPTWGHGMNQGPLTVAYDTIELATADEAQPIHLHIQAISRFTMGNRVGRGVLEQLIVGPHEPSGFKSLFDTAP